MNFEEFFLYNKGTLLAKAFFSTFTHIFLTFSTTYFFNLHYKRKQYALLAANSM